MTNNINKKKMKTIKEILRDRQLYLMLVPFLLYYIIFLYVPMYGLQIAFKDYSPFKGIFDSTWVGLKYFKQFFDSPYAWRVIRNTLGINLYLLAVQFPLTVFMALLLNEIKRAKLKSFIQTVVYVPHFVSVVVAASLVITMLSPSSGVINGIISALGGEKIYFLIKPEYFKTIYVIMRCWLSLGFDTIIYTSAMCSIDQSLYDAAEVDGAGRWAKMRHITLPGIASTTVVLLIMKIGNMLTVGSEAILLLYQPVTYETADVISTFVYRAGLVDNNYSYSTAVGLLQSFVSMILVVGANKISKKVNETSLW